MLRRVPGARRHKRTGFAGARLVDKAETSELDLFKKEKKKTGHFQLLIARDFSTSKT